VIVCCDDIVGVVDTVPVAEILLEVIPAIISISSVVAPFINT
jgi:hypothetical protein